MKPTLDGHSFLNALDQYKRMYKQNLIHICLHFDGFLHNTHMLRITNINCIELVYFVMCAHWVRTQWLACQ